MKSFIEACDSLAKDYKTSAVVQLKNSAGSAMTSSLEGYMGSTAIQKEWTAVCVQLHVPVEVATKLTSKPKLREGVE